MLELVSMDEEGAFMRTDILKVWSLTELCEIAYSKMKYKDSAIGKNMCIRKQMQPIIKKYSGCELYPDGQASEKLIVWMLWWQGENQMPPVVKMCYQSILKSFDGCAEVRLLTESNIHEYVSLPDYIEAKRRTGILSLTHYSDIVRFYLLSRYGGLWIDATYFAAKRVPKEVLNSSLYTIRIPHPNVKHNNDYIWYDWSINFIKLPAGSLLGKFVEESLLYYWKNHTAIEYYFTDHLVKIAYDLIPTVKREIDLCGYNNVSTHKLLPLLNKAIDTEKYNEITNDTSFFKLSTKTNYVKATDKGEETLFSELLRTQTVEN